MSQILAIAIAMAWGSPASNEPRHDASSEGFCQPRSRCSDYEVCYINDIAQPCAWGRGGATRSAIIFEHGVFHLQWISQDDLEITYGDKNQYKTKAVPRRKNGYIIYELQDGVTVRHPWNFGE